MNRVGEAVVGLHVPVLHDLAHVPHRSLTSHATGIVPDSPPSAASGCGARRVQSTNPSDAGSPLATPRVKGVADCARG